MEKKLTRILLNYMYLIYKNYMKLNKNVVKFFTQIKYLVEIKNQVYSPHPKKSLPYIY